MWALLIGTGKHDKECHVPENFCASDNCSMRSARLLSMLLLLQTRGRIRSAELAAHFEVSQRTILRDVDALSAAGVPVYTEQGPHGGIVLDRRSRLNASRLDPTEIQLMKILGVGADVLEHLGFAKDIAQLQKKVNAVSRPPVSDVHSLDEKVLLDSSSWFSSETHSDLEELLQAVRKEARIKVLYRRSGEKTSHWDVVDPYGLVHKGRSWYLVVDISGKPRMLAVSRLENLRILGQGAQLRAGHSLPSVWEQLVEQLEADMPVHITALLRASRVDMAFRILGSRLIQQERVDDDWVRIVVGYADIQGVRQLLQFGDNIWITDPPEAVKIVADLAKELAERHSGMSFLWNQTKPSEA